MQKILCFTRLASFPSLAFTLLVSILVSLCLSGCETVPAQTNETNYTTTVVVGNPVAANVGCSKLGSPRNFNDQRIVAFQKLVQLQILRIKALPMTQESTQELARVEAIRRRVSYPLLTSSSRPVVVTRILTREAKKFSEFLDERKKTDPQAQGLYEEVNTQFLPSIENEEKWNCVEKQTDFQEVLPEIEKTE